MEDDCWQSTCEMITNTNWSFEISEISPLWLLIMIVFVLWCRVIDRISRGILYILGFILSLYSEKVGKIINRTIIGKGLRWSYLRLTDTSSATVMWGV